MIDRELVLAQIEKAKQCAGLAIESANCSLKARRYEMAYLKRARPGNKKLQAKVLGKAMGYRSRSASCLIQMFFVMAQPIPPKKFKEGGHKGRDIIFNNHTKFVN